MNFARPIVAHLLAASLLVTGICPCPRAPLAEKPASPQLAAAGEHHAQHSIDHLGKRRCCCLAKCDGRDCGMACCRTAESPGQVPPAGPNSRSSQSQERVLLAFADLPAVQSACQATALHRSTSPADGRVVPLRTLQAQSVRIQT